MTGNTNPAGSHYQEVAALKLGYIRNGLLCRIGHKAKSRTDP